MRKGLIQERTEKITNSLHFLKCVWGGGENTSASLFGGRLNADTVQIRDSAHPQIAPPKKVTKPDRPIKHAYRFSMDKPPPRRYALKKKLMKPDRLRAPSRIFTV